MTENKLRLAFMGTPDFVIPVLSALIDTPWVDVACAYTQPPRPKSRGKELLPAPVHAYALERHIPVRTPVHFKDEAEIAAFRDLNLDVAVVAGYGLLLPQSILSAPRAGCLNVHPSLLPRWRGPSPIQYTILSGDTKTGVCVMQLDKGMDTGPVISCRSVDLSGREISQTLNDVLWPMGAEDMIAALKTLRDTGAVPSTPQSAEGVTYSKMFKKEDGKIDWNQSAVEIDRRVRALTPWPGTFCDTPDGCRMKIMETSVEGGDAHVAPGTVLNKRGDVACGGGSVLRLIRVQPENKKPMDVAASLNGGYVVVGSTLR